MPSGQFPVKASRAQWRVLEQVRRAFGEFLTVPLVVVAGFLLMGLGAYAVDTGAGPRSSWGPLWRWLDHFVGDPETATGLLSTLAGGLITVTSITFSILLLAIQQGASALTNQIFDQYLRRVSNQLYFGMFVGASLYLVETLALINDSYHPVLGVVLAVVVTIVALGGLIPLIYSTIEQTKPVTIIGTIHDSALKARQKQRAWLERTAEPLDEPGSGQVITSITDGYVARIHVAGLEKVARDGRSIELLVSLGDFAPCGSPLAVVRPAGADEIADAVRRAVTLARERELSGDPGFAVDQLSAIGWTATSTAKSNPAAALIAIHALQDLLWRWLDDRTLSPERPGSAPVRYRDGLSQALMDSFESLIVVASESMQHQSLAAVMEALTRTFPAQPDALKARTEELLLVSLAVLGDHAPTRLLQARFEEAAAALAVDGRTAVATALQTAWSKLGRTRGTLHSRSSRG